MEIKDSLIVVESVEKMTKNSTSSILGATEDRSSAKGFYRLLNHDTLSVDILLEEVRKNTIENILEYETVFVI